MNESEQGPIDDLVLAKVRALVMTATEPGRLQAALVELCPDMHPDLIVQLAAWLSVKGRSVLMPLVA